MQLSLGTGLAAGRRGPRPHVPGAPVLVRPPALVGDGRIGADLAADPGDWTGAARIEFAWLKNGAPIPGATGRIHVPTAADDRAALACRITAVGPGGRAVAQTSEMAVTFSKPLLVGSFPDLDYTLGTGSHIVDTSPIFSGSSLSFSVTGDHVAVDPATGVLTIDTEALLSGSSILLVASNSGGQAEFSFTLKVRPAHPAAVPPTLIVEPTIAGSGRVGAELVADPGGWTGAPAPDLALQWLRAGAPIKGATEARFTPGETEDGAAIACRVTASNAAGAVEAETGAVIVVQAPPQATGAPADLVLAQKAGAHRVTAAGAFTGAALRFSAVGANAEIDARTGVVSIPTEAPRVGETVTVTAANSGGAVSVRFAVTVLAAPVRLAAPAPAVLAQGGEGTIPTQALFGGLELVYALEDPPAGVAIDPKSGLVTFPTASAVVATLMVRASNLAGTATQSIKVTVLAAPAALAAPVALAAPPAVLFAKGGGPRTISAQSYFSGADLAYALDGAPAGVTINPGSGLVIVPTAAALRASLVVRATNAAGEATQRVSVEVFETTSVFDAPAKLADVSFVPRNAPPSWTYDAAAGWAVFSPGNPNDFTHGDWSKARGDGRYRVLVRIGHSAVPPKIYTRARPFGFNGRMGRSGADMRGIRVELDRLVDGTTSLEIREYTGSAEAMTVVGVASAPWNYNVWYWMETEFNGPRVRARVYPEAEAAPAWQAEVTTKTLNDGFFGPMSHTFSGVVYPIIQIRRIEYYPISVTPVEPSGDDWNLEQILVQK